MGKMMRQNTSMKYCVAKQDTMELKIVKSVDAELVSNDKTKGPTRQQMTPPCFRYLNLVSIYPS